MLEWLQEARSHLLSMWMCMCMRMSVSFFWDYVYIVQWVSVVWIVLVCMDFGLSLFLSLNLSVCLPYLLQLSNGRCKYFYRICT